MRKKKKEKSELAFKKLKTDSLRKVLGNVRGGLGNSGTCTAQGDKGGAGGSDSCACGCN